VATRWFLRDARHIFARRATYLLGAPASSRQIVAGEWFAVADIVAAIMCRLEADAP